MVTSIPRIGITMGDPAGIGPEIILKAYGRRLPRHIPVVFGDANVLKEAARILPAAPPIREIHTAAEARPGELTLLPVTNLPPEAVRPGRVSAVTGKAAGQYIEAAIAAAARGEIDAVVTCPIHKRAFHEGGYPYPGHTEMFAALTETRRYAMMMVSVPLKVTLATIHLPLRNVAPSLTRPGVETAIDLTLRTTRDWFGIEHPRICVVGLNPHAGEGGDMGREELEIIDPAIWKFREKGENVTGPLPADTAFTRKNLGSYDAFVAMYHDQGLIPFKLLAFESGVNCTLGLPFPRVSVDHGTALDIAGSGTADPGSLRSAIRWAVRFSKTVASLNRHATT